MRFPHWQARNKLVGKKQTSSMPLGLPPTRKVLYSSDTHLSLDNPRTILFSRNAIWQQWVKKTWGWEMWGEMLATEERRSRTEPCSDDARKQCNAGSCNHCNRHCSEFYPNALSVLAIKKTFFVKKTNRGWHPSPRGWHNMLSRCTLMVGRVSKWLSLLLFQGIELLKNK